MLAPPYKTAVIGRTGRGDYGHGLDVAVLDQPEAEVGRRRRRGPEGPAAAAKRLGVERAYDDYRAMLDREKPQFVVVGPRWLDGHKEMILACAESGVSASSARSRWPPTSPSATRSSRPASGRTSSSPWRSRRATARAYERVKAADRRGGDRRGARAPRAGQGGSSRRGRGPDGPGRPHHRPLPRPARRAGLVLRPRHRSADGRSARARSATGAEGIGPLAGDRIDAMFGFAGHPGRRPLRDRPPGGAGPAVRADDLRLEGLHLDGHRLDAPRLPPARSHLDGHRPDGLVADHRAPATARPSPGAERPGRREPRHRGRPDPRRRDRHAAANARAGGTDGRRDGPGLLRLALRGGAWSRCRWPTATLTRFSGRPALDHET